MRIGIDCRLAGIRHAGIGRYIVELVQHLPTYDTAHSWVVFASNTLQIHELFPEGIPDTVTVVITPTKHYGLAEQWQIFRAASKAKLDVFHVPHFNIPILYRGALVVTIHDLLWHEYGGLHSTTLSPILYLLKYWAYRFTTSQAVKKASIILVPTHVVQHTIARYYGETSQKCLVTPEGIPSNWLKGKLPSLQKRTITSPLLYVGSLYPHKSVITVLEALQKNASLQLTIVSSRSAFTEKTKTKAKQLGVSDQITWKFQLSDEELLQELRSCLALVQPSISEGFGLTGLEAMAAGTPVLASNIATFREVYQDHAFYFEAGNTDSFTAAVEDLQQLSVSTLEKQIKSAREHAATFSWQRLADQTWDVYQSIGHE